MEGYIFDIHEIPLIITAGQCGLLGGILFLCTSQGRAGNNILGLLLLIFGIRAIDDLLYWNSLINPLIVEHIGIWFFWVFEWVPLGLGPLVYAYIQLRLVGKKILWKQGAIHSIPIIVGILLLLCSILQLDEKTWQSGVSNWGIWYDKSTFYQLYLGLEKLSIITYAIISLRFMKRHKDKLTGAFSDVERTEPTWLYVIAGGLLILGLWFGSFAVVDYSGLGFLTLYMGTLTNYFVFIYITTLVAFSLINSHLTTALVDTSDTPLNQSDHIASKSIASALHQRLIEDKLYLNPELTLNNLAIASNMSSRQVSEVLNIEMGKNFFDFVNSARVDKAKELLFETPLPIVEVFQQSGFNSKASFNRIFKRYVNLTPSEFRKANNKTNINN